MSAIPSPSPSLARGRAFVARPRSFLPALALVSAFALFVSSAIAGSLTYTKKTVQESGGGWHLMMTIAYGGKPHTAHIPMRFTFTPTAITERYLDDAHGDKPQSRKIPLVGQTPLNESVDVDFSDGSGRIFDKTRFDFTITRSHGFVAGDYSVTVHRSDGAAMGGAQTLILEGENPVIDRRAISFVGTGPKKKPEADAGAPAATTETKSDSAEAPADPAAAPASSAAPSEEPPADPAAAAKVPPGSHGCGCRFVGGHDGAGADAAGPENGPLTRTSGAWAAVALGLTAAGLRLRRRSLPL